MEENDGDIDINDLLSKINSNFNLNEDESIIYFLVYYIFKASIHEIKEKE